MTSATTTQSSDNAPSARMLLQQADALFNTDPAAAAGLLQQARVLARAEHDRGIETDVIMRIAAVTLDGGRVEEAFAVALEARDLARSSEYPSGEVDALRFAGRLLYDVGDFSGAADRLVRALEVYQSAGLRGEEPEILWEIARAQLGLGSFDRALVTLESSRSATQGMDRIGDELRAVRAMAEVHAQRNEHFLAVGLADQAVALANEHAPSHVGALHIRLAESYRMLADDNAAESHLRAAYAAAASQPEDIDLRISLMLAECRWRIGRGDLESAATLAQSAADSATAAQRADAFIDALAERLAVERAAHRHADALVTADLLRSEQLSRLRQQAELRLRLATVAHDTDITRHQAEVVRMRTTDLEAIVSTRTSLHEHFSLRVLLALTERGDHLAGRQHSMRVGDLAAAIARDLGEPEEWCAMLRVAAQVHDVGKALVPDSLVSKPDTLTPDEMDLMRQHASLGADLLDDAPSPMLQLAAVIARHHHERWDGDGYPAGLERAHIPFAARIVAVADVFDAMTTPRADRPAHSVQSAVASILADAGRHFDPRVVEAFSRVIGRIQPGSAPG
jgi:putative two-component system response regulator